MTEKPATINTVEELYKAFRYWYLYEPDKLIHESIGLTVEQCNDWLNDKLSDKAVLKILQKKR